MNNKNYSFKFLYNGTEIDISFKSSIIISGLKKKYLKTEEFEELFFLHHLGLAVYKGLKSLISNIEMIGHLELHEEAHQSERNKFCMFLDDYNLNAEFTVFGEAEVVQNFLMNYHAKQLKLENMNKHAKLFDKLSFQTDGVDFELSVASTNHLITERDTSYIRLKLLVCGITEIIYAPKSFFSWVLSIHYGNPIPVTHENELYLESAVCLINIWLSKLKNSSITVIDWIIAAPLYDTYTKIVLENKVFSTTILCNKESSVLKNIFTSGKNNNQNKQNDMQKSAIQLDDKVSYPVFGVECEINKAQLADLTTNSTVFNLINSMVSDTVIIEIGDVEILAKYYENKLTIIDKKQC